MTGRFFEDYGGPSPPYVGPGWPATGLERNERGYLQEGGILIEETTGKVYRWAKDFCGIVLGYLGELENMEWKRPPNWPLRPEGDCWDYRMKPSVSGK